MINFLWSNLFPVLGIVEEGGGTSITEPVTKPTEEPEASPTPEVDLTPQLFMEELNRLAGAVQAQATPEQIVTESTPAEPRATGVKIPEGDDFTELFTDQQKFKTFINSLVVHAHQTGRQEMLNSMNTTIEKAFVKNNKQNQAKETFWSNNKDLFSAKEFVAAMATSIQGQHPDWDINQIYTEAGKEVRASLVKLGLNKTEAPVHGTKTRGVTSNNNPGKDTSSQVRELASRRMKL